MEEDSRVDERGPDRVNLLLLRLVFLLWLAAMPLMLTGEGPPPGTLRAKVRLAVAGDTFDFLGWTLGTMVDKLTFPLVAPQRYMDEAARRDFFLDYLRLTAAAQALSQRIEWLYADPEVSDPAAEAAPLRDTLARYRRELAYRRPIVEAILQEQTASVLYDAGFGALGQVWPPVNDRLTALPTMLVVSPRDHIENIFSLSLRHGMDAARREEIEAQVDEAADVSSLVTDIGGLSTYPAMLLEINSLVWLTNVSAHEWTHIYLLPYPLGRDYGSSPDSLTINETVASIVGEEIGWRTMFRYYPALLPAPTPPSAPSEPTAPPQFDFRQEMRRTRIHVDDLLAQGQISAAERYMEERRQVFVAHGYRIRKLNQAYFAFHGSYASKPGAAGEDPIGPAVLRLRARSPNLHAFVTQIAHVTTLAELRELLGEPSTTESTPR